MTADAAVSVAELPSSESTSPLEDEPNHYVLVVHGTFNAPEEGKVKWFQLDPDDPQNFCHRLNEELRDGPIGAAVGRPRPGGNSTAFSWSGGNTDADRTDAAHELARHIAHIGQEDPRARISIVAHSHGGNVALWAIHRYLCLLASRKKDHPGGPTQDGFTTPIRRLVVLGTPFLRKNWESRPLRERIISLLANLTLLTAFGYVVGVVSHFLVLLGLLLFNNRRPPLLSVVRLAWPEVVCLALVVAWWLWQVMRPEEVRSTNVYVDEQDWVELPRPSPVPTLVVSAGLLDEPLLGMSAQPIIVRYLEPILAGITKPRVRPPRRDLHRLIGLPGEDVGRESLRLVSHYPRVAIAIVSWPLRYVVHLVVQPILRSVLSRVIASAATGLPPRHFGDARIEVRKTIDVPWLFQEFAWDVTRTLAEAPPARTATDTVGLDEYPTAAARRYAFLWDAEARARAAAACRLLQSVSSAGGDLASLEPHDLLCLAMEERLKELAGSVELAHSAYYTNPTVIRGIARFLEIDASLEIDGAPLLATLLAASSPDRIVEFLARFRVNDSSRHNIDASVGDDGGATTTDAAANTSAAVQPTVDLDAPDNVPAVDTPQRADSTK